MIHVYPTAEEDQHVLDGTDCPCGPEFDVSEPELIAIHNRLEPEQS